MFRVDVPELPEREVTLEASEWTESFHCPAGSKVIRQAVKPRTRLINPAAVYALNPCTEEAARAALERMIPRKTILLELPPERSLTDGIRDPDDDDYDDGEVEP